MNSGELKFSSAAFDPNEHLNKYFSSFSYFSRGRGGSKSNDNKKLPEMTSSGTEKQMLSIPTTLKTEISEPKEEESSPIEIPDSVGFSTTTTTSVPMTTSSTVDHTSGLTATQGLPSPASSTSETSDYQRSTPSPRNEQEPCNGKISGNSVCICFMQ
jgi:hypothetical protein